MRDRLGYGPRRLTRDHNHHLLDLCEHPGLPLGICCGLPLRTGLNGGVQLVGSPVNDLPGCPREHCFSRIVIPAEASPKPLAACAAARLAFNQSHRQSGRAAAQNHVADHGFHFTNMIETGAHRESARTLAGGRAGIASIAAVSWELIREHDAFAAALQAIGDTVPTPGEPVLTVHGTHPAAPAAAFAAAIEALAPADRATLHLGGFADAEALPLAACRPSPRPPGPGARRH